MTQWIGLEHLKQLTDLDEEGATAALPLCHAGIEAILPLLRDDAPQGDVRIAQAAAAIAWHKLLCRRMGSDEAVTTFKAGDVTVTRSLGVLLEEAEKQRDEAMLRLLPLMKDEQFLFEGVEV